MYPPIVGLSPDVLGIPRRCLCRGGGRRRGFLRRGNAGRDEFARRERRGGKIGQRVHEGSRAGGALLHLYSARAAGPSRGGFAPCRAGHMVVRRRALRAEGSFRSGYAAAQTSHSRIVTARGEPCRRLFRFPVEPMRLFEMALRLACAWLVVT